MAGLSAEETRAGTRTGSGLGVRARLLLAFAAIAAFAVVAAIAGIYASSLVGERLDSIDERVSPTLTALELSRLAERIIAAAPALLAATDRTRRDAVNAELQDEAARLNSGLLELTSNTSGALPIATIEPIVSSLTVELAALEELVTRRLETSERLGSMRRRLFDTSDAVQRLLAPWLEVVEGQISLLIDSGDSAAASESEDVATRLASLIQSQRLLQTAQRHVSASVDMLADASTAQQPDRLPILAFQVRLALRDVEAAASGLDPKLRPLFTEQVAKLRAFVDGPDAIAEARGQELQLIGQGEERLGETARLSTQLTAAVDRLGNVAKDEVGNAVGEALSVQQLSSRILLGLAVLSLITSILIVWLYVGRNIAHRLTELSAGTLAIADGHLDKPIVAAGNDEIAAMGRAVEVFRHNAIELERLLEERKAAAARLEHIVEERTRELEEANKYKSQFLAAASHDLRQPLHALNLFVDQFRSESNLIERSRIVPRINAAMSSMNELLDALLDMSKLEAGLLEADVTVFPVQDLLDRIESTFTNMATDKGLRLAIVASRAWIRSDFVLLERILLNLVSNAVRHTTHGGIVVGCRRHGGCLRLDVCDSGPGIADSQKAKIFDEFYQISAANADRPGGLGLGLSIVDRLARLLDHPIELASRPDRGSRFSISVPLAEPTCTTTDTGRPTSEIPDPARDKLVVVIDDDPLVLESMRGILRSWGCRVATASSAKAALAEFADTRDRPDLIISDFRLAKTENGIEAIERLRGAFGPSIPAFLISGDTTPEGLRHARESGHDLLHKPVSPMRLRAMVNQLLKNRNDETGRPGKSS